MTVPASAHEWFTPVWVVPALLLIMVILYAILRGSPQAAGVMP